MEKIIYILIGMSIMFASTALAKVVTIPDVLQRVDELPYYHEYEPVSKVYDSNANVICYEMLGEYGGISCLKNTN